MQRVSEPTTRPPWDIRRAMIFGAAIGLVAAAFKLYAPLIGLHDRLTFAATVREFVGAALSFALLCGVVAVLRNFIQRRLGESESRSRQ